MNKFDQYRKTLLTLFLLILGFLFAIVVALPPILYWFGFNVAHWSIWCSIGCTFYALITTVVWPDKIRNRCDTTLAFHKYLASLFSDLTFCLLYLFHQIPHDIGALALIVDVTIIIISLPKIKKDLVDVFK